jgi:PleD family two-component response regulator
MSFRTYDVVCHVGVAEFLVICPLTNHAGTVQLTDRVRSALPGLSVRLGTGTWTGPISSGVAEFGPGGDTLKKLIQLATSRRWPLEPKGVSA